MKKTISLYLFCSIIFFSALNAKAVTLYSLSENSDAVGVW